MEESSFTLNGASSLTVVNHTEKDISISLNHWIAVPFGSEEATYIVSAGESKQIQIQMQGKAEYALGYDSAMLRLFTQPEAVDTITFSSMEGKRVLRFKGNNAAVNHYIQTRSEAFEAVDALWLPRAEATQTAVTLEGLFEFNDSLTIVHTDYLLSKAHSLPEAYVLFEKERIVYINEGFKLNSLFYRKSLLGKNEALPEGYLKELENRVKINNPEMLGEMRYIYFLNDYIHFKGNPKLDRQQPASNSEWADWFTHYFTIARNKLKGDVKDVYLAFSMSKLIDDKPHLFEEEWLEFIDDTLISSAISEIRTQEVLPSGADIPYFYLETEDGGYYHPADFNGDVILINFWATWCKPCIQEFPGENELVELYADKPVTIITICIDSDKETWREYLEKYSLDATNLYANENWTDILSAKFDISGLPHSILINQDGEVVQNKSPQASEGIKNMIEELLIERN